MCEIWHQKSNSRHLSGCLKVKRRLLNMSLKDIPTGIGTLISHGKYCLSLFYVIVLKNLLVLGRIDQKWKFHFSLLGNYHYFQIF